MPGKNHHIATLIVRRLTGELTDEEALELEDWINASGRNRALAEELLTNKNLLSGLRETYLVEQKIRQRLEEKLFAKKNMLQKREEEAVVYAIRKGPRIRKWISVAASFVLLTGIGIFFYLHDHTSSPVAVAKKLPADIEAPVLNRAMVKMADGSMVYLDSMQNGQSALQGNMKLVKLDSGRIAYQLASGEIIKEAPYNTLYNPRGSNVINIQLADGSRVWLNAGSSITYPIAFIEKERKVSMEGEAYFEITRDKEHPFLVKTNRQTVEVLGTHFSVNSYADEPDEKITLLEGKVKVSAGLSGKQDNVSKPVLLDPGQQSILSNDRLSVISVDAESFIDWKNGVFIFKDEPLPSIMRRIARWYDIEVVYPDGIPATEYFKGRLSRFEKVSMVLDMLEQTGDVYFVVQGKSISVYPSKNNGE